MNGLGVNGTGSANTNYAAGITQAFTSSQSSSMNNGGSNSFAYGPPGVGSLGSAAAALHGLQALAVPHGVHGHVENKLAAGSLSHVARERNTFLDVAYDIDSDSEDETEGDTTGKNSDKTGNTGNTNKTGSSGGGGDNSSAKTDNHGNGMEQAQLTTRRGRMRHRETKSFALRPRAGSE